MKNTISYDKKLLWQLVFGLIAMGVGMRLTGGMAFAAIYVCILLSFAKNRTEWLLYFLLMTIAMTNSNSLVIPKSGTFGLIARSVHFLIAGVMGLQLVAQRNSRMVTPLLSILLYIFYMACVSWQGWMPMLSYLKMLLFVVMYLGFYSVANAAASRSGVRVDRLRSVFLSFAMFFVLGSICVMPFPGLSTMSAEVFFQQFGYYPEDGLFMGMALHSQALGPMAVAFGVILLADSLFSLKRWDKLYIVLLLCIPILVYKTGSRTAMGTLLIISAFIGFVFMNARGVSGRWRARALNTLMLLAVIVGLSLFTTPQMRRAVAKFALKYVSDDQELVVNYENLASTRQGSIDSQLANLKESPIIGNGFQVSKQMQTMQIVSWKQLLSAPVEKGVWVTAVLEEGGGIGFAVFCMVALSIIYLLWTRQAYTGLSVFMALLVSNLGEFTMFSMTATGGIVWILIFVGVALDAQRIRQACQLSGSLR